MNSLLEPEIIQALYEASQAGVSIELLGPDGGVIASGASDGTGDGQTIDVTTGL